MSHRRSSKLGATPSVAAMRWLKSTAVDSREDGPTPARPLANTDRLATLTRIIEGEVLPRLMLSLSSATTTGWTSKPAIPDSDEIEQLARLLSSNPTAAAAFVQAIRDRGTPAECICGKLFAPTARRLGELWEQNQCTFQELNKALAHLLALLRELSSGQH